MSTRTPKTTIFFVVCDHRRTPNVSSSILDSQRFHSTNQERSFIYADDSLFNWVTQIVADKLSKACLLILASSEDGCQGHTLLLRFFCSPLLWWPSDVTPLLPRVLSTGHIRSNHKLAGSTVHTINYYESLSRVWLVATQFEFTINNKKITLSHWVWLSSLKKQRLFIHSFISLFSMYPYICKTMDVETVILIINVFVIKQMSKTKHRYITWIT